MISRVRLGMVLLSALFMVGCNTASPNDVIPPDDLEAAGAETSCMSAVNETAVKAELFSRISEIREEAGLSPLILDESLCAAAENHGCAMIEAGFFDHINPEDESSPGDRAVDVGYAFYSVGENLAAGQKSAEEVVNQWMESPAHRANILSEDWEETGIAVRVGGDYGVYWIQMFADRFEMPIHPSVPTTRVIAITPGASFETAQD